MNPPQTRSWRILAVSAVETRIRSAIFCDCMASSDCARQHNAFSAVCNRFGKPGHITGFVPFGVDYPKCGESSLWVSVLDHVIGITKAESRRVGLWRERGGFESYPRAVPRQNQNPRPHSPRAGWSLCSEVATTARNQ